MKNKKCDEKEGSKDREKKFLKAMAKIHKRYAKTFKALAK